MRRALSQMATIAHLTAAQALRSAAFTLVWLAALAAAGVLPRLDYVALYEQRQLVTDSLLALTLSAGVLAGLLAAVDGVGGEVRRGTLALLRARGASGEVVLAGQLLGLALSLVPLWFSLALGVVWGARVAAVPFHSDNVASGGWWLAILVALAASGLLRGRLALAWTLPLALALAAAALASVGAGWLRADWALFGPATLALGGMVLAAWLAAVLALCCEPVPALLLGAVIFLGGLTSHHGLLAWLPSWSPFQQRAAGVDGLLRAGGYLLAYGLALWAVGSGLPATKEPR